MYVQLMCVGGWDSLGVSLCIGFECVKNFRFDLVLVFSVEDYFSYAEKRTAIRELLVSLDKNRRDEEEHGDEDDEGVDDLMGCSVPV